MTKTKEQETKALAVMDTDMFNLAEIAEGSSDIQDNLDQVEIRLPQIKIIHQAQMFELPDGTKAQSIQGFILDFNKINSYWRESFDQTGGGTPPDCFSLDGAKPSPYSGEIQSATCPECPQNQFVSEPAKGGGRSRGKACKNLKRVHIITRSNQLLPYRLTLPPSNLRTFDQYISSLVAQGYAFRMVYTDFSLKPTKNKDGITYAELVLTPVSAISKEQARVIKTMSERLGPILRDNILREEIAAAA